MFMKNLSIVYSIFNFFTFDLEFSDFHLPYLTEYRRACFCILYYFIKNNYFSKTNVILLICILLNCINDEYKKITNFN